VFVRLQDISSLVENAPSQHLALEVLSYAFLNSAAATEDREELSSRIEQMVSSLIASYTGTDAVTLLEFLADFLRQLDKDVSPLQMSLFGPPCQPGLRADFAVSRLLLFIARKTASSTKPAVAHHACGLHRGPHLQSSYSGSQVCICKPGGHTSAGIPRTNATPSLFRYPNCGRQACLIPAHKLAPHRPSFVVPLAARAA